MCETISEVDFEKISTLPPKWFMGYSDNTNFIFPLVTQYETAAIYGQNFTGFGKKWERAELEAESLLRGTNFLVKGYSHFQSPDVSENENVYILNQKSTRKAYTVKNGKLSQLSEDESLSFDGILVGGCLDVLSNLCGTRFDSVKEFNKKYDKVIWVLEACDLSILDIRRAFWHLQESHWFKNASGFVIGRPLASYNQNCMGLDRFSALKEPLEKCNVPVIFDADIGHIDPIMPIIMGSFANVLFSKDDFSINMKTTIHL